MPSLARDLRPPGGVRSAPQSAEVEVSSIPASDQGGAPRRGAQSPEAFRRMLCGRAVGFWSQLASQCLNFYKLKQPFSKIK